MWVMPLLVLAFVEIGQLGTAADFYLLAHLNQIAGLERQDC
jgi:hypothetical protein